MAQMRSRQDQTVSVQVLEWLGHESNAASVLLTAQRLLTIQNSLALQLPQHLQACFVVLKWSEGELKLGTLGSAQAAKLRQYIPRLEAHMESMGFKTDVVTVKVMAESPVPAPLKQAKDVNPLAQHDLRHFEALAHTLTPGPLADAVKQLVKRRQS